MACGLCESLRTVYWSCYPRVQADTDNNNTREADTAAPMSLVLIRAANLPKTTVFRYMPAVVQHAYRDTDSADPLPWQCILVHMQQIPLEASDF